MKDDAIYNESINQSFVLSGVTDVVENENWVNKIWGLHITLSHCYIIKKNTKNKTSKPEYFCFFLSTSSNANDRSFIPFPLMYKVFWANVIDFLIHKMDEEYYAINNKEQ